MGRPRVPLATRYGRLTVVTDLGGENTFVRCDCGAEKWVARSNLRAGRIRSCGGAGCRTRAAKEPMSKAELISKKRAPGWLPISSIPGAWEACRAPEGAESIATTLNQPVHKVLELAEAIRATGGIERYMAWVSGEDVPPPKSKAKQPVRTVDVKAPAPMYTGPL